MNSSLAYPRDTLLSALRHSTAAAHEAMHHHPALRDLTSPQVTLSYYHAALRGFYGFHQGLETALLAAPPLGELAPYQAGVVTPLLRSDLAAAGIAPVGVPARPAPGVLSPAQAAAYLYLREGSALGGQLIARNLQARLGLGPAETRFFTGIGKETGRRWRDFCAALGQTSLPEKAVAGYAEELFAALGTWMERDVA